VGASVTELRAREQLVQALGFCDTELTTIGIDDACSICENCVPPNSRGNITEIAESLHALPHDLWDRPMAAVLLGRYIASAPGKAQTLIANSSVAELQIIRFTTMELIKDAADAVGIPSDELLDEFRELCWDMQVKGKERIIEKDDIRSAELYEEARRGHLGLFEPVRAGTAIQFYHLRIATFLAAQEWAKSEDTPAEACVQAQEDIALRAPLRYFIQGALEQQPDHQHLMLNRDLVSNGQTDLRIMTELASVLPPVASLTLDLKGCSFPFSSLKGLSPGLARFVNLNTLHLNFCDCWSLKSLEELGQLRGLGRLHSLHLDCSFCEELTSMKGLDQGLAGLKELRSMHLNFGKCSKLTSIKELDEGLAQLKALTTAHLNFSRCSSLKSSETFGNGFRQLQALDSLHLDFSRCEELTSIKGLEQGLGQLEVLRSMHLNFERCVKLASISELQEGLVQLKGLTSALLKFSGCSSLKCVEELGESLVQLQTLTSLHLDFTGCVKPTSVEKFGKNLALLKALNTLYVAFEPSPGLPKVMREKFASENEFLIASPPYLIFASCSGLPKVLALLTSGFTSVEDFGRCLVHVQTLTHLDLNFSGCSSLTSLQEFGKGIMQLRGLTSLILNFSNCASIMSIDALGKGLATLQALSSVNLCFYQCSLLTSIAEIGKGLAQLQGLTSLILDFEACATLLSIEDLWTDLAQLKALTSLDLNFHGCMLLTSIEGLGQALVQLMDLSLLVLNFYNCCYFTSIDELLESLTQVQKLKSVTLNFGGCQKITSIAGLEKTLEELQGLTSINLNFWICSAVTSIEGLWKPLVQLQNLTTLDLNFGGCQKLASIEELGKGVKELQTLSSVNMNFQYCRGLPMGHAKKFSSSKDISTALGLEPEEENADESANGDDDSVAGSAGNASPEGRGTMIESAMDPFSREISTFSRSSSKS